jgi:SAM-dependent methyltransferase
MSDSDREKWERRYAEGSYEARTHPTRLLVEWLPRIGKPEGARALDLACGAGRNALYLASEGYRVDAMDISGVALTRGAARATEMGVEVEWIEIDLDHVALTPARYDLVVVARYDLLYEQHLQTDRDVGGPRNPEFRLRPNELLDMFRVLRVLYYREGIMKDPDGPTMALAQLVACRGSPGF